MSVFLQPGAKQKIWWYRFMMRGQVIRCSTKQSNHKVALQLEAEHKSKLAKGDMGIFEKTPAPTLAAFAKEFLVWASAEFQAKPKTYAYYHNSVHRLLEYPPLMSLTLDDKRIPERLTGYKVKRQANGLAVSSLNHELRCARRLLRVAVEWGRIEVSPRIKLLSGEAHRERVITAGEEARYLAAAPPLLASVATVLIDTGMRPEECYRLRWEYVTWVNGRHGSMLVTHGKTKAARRVLPMSSRVRVILEERWQQQGQPLEGWVWPAPTRSGHVEPSSLKKQHARALKLSEVRPFVLYSFRHTFLTRLGAAGCDVWRLAQIAGHGSIAISMRYVHPQGDAVLDAMERPGRQEFGHGAKTEEEERLLSA
jgi:integrase